MKSWAQRWEEWCDLWIGDDPEEKKAPPAERLIYGSTKTYTHSVGLSCCFRQWRAESHCNMIHGYALQITLDFMTYTPDERGWVVDFGGQKEVKSFLEGTFDHKLILANDDPEVALFEVLRTRRLAEIVYLPGVGCENFAKYIMQRLDTMGLILDGDRVIVRKVTVAEHGGNSAYVERALLSGHPSSYVDRSRHGGYIPGYRINGL